MLKEYNPHRKLIKDEIYSNQQYIYGTAVPNLNTEIHDILSEDQHKQFLKKQKAEKAKKIVSYKLKLVANVFIIFLGCLFLMGQYASITFNQKEIQGMKLQLKEIQNANISLKSEIAGSIDLSFIKQKAINKLGMVEPAPHQIVYIDIPKVSYTAYYQPEIEKRESQEKDFVAASFFDFLNWKE